MSDTSYMPAHAQARLDAVLNAAPKASAPTEHHLLMKARTLVDTDRATSRRSSAAKPSTGEKDSVLAPAMVTALKAWTKVDKLIPLLWSHSAAAEDVVGHIEPASAEAVNGQVLVKVGSIRAPSAARRHGDWSRAACWDLASVI
jgi:hypothetical protein